MTNHTLYDNFVLENKITSLLNTRLDVQNLMVIDKDLKEEAGVTKVINTYSYAGAAESVAKGEANTEGSHGVVTFVPTEYKVGTTQHTFIYHDEDVEQDPMVVEVGLKGSADIMSNDIKTKYFKELAKATLSIEASVLSYDAVVDAIEQMNLEEEEGLFLIINPSQKAEVRKDPDFKSARQGEILFKGQIGDISGVPVIVSKLADNAYLATKEAVTCFIKKESKVEQDRDIHTRRNDVVVRRVNLVALTNATKVVKIVKPIVKATKVK